MAKTKSLDHDFVAQLRSFCIFIERKSGVTAARFKKKLHRYGIFKWNTFINMPESQFKEMFERKFRIKLVKWIREWYANPVYLSNRSPKHRRAVAFTGRRIDVCKSPR